ncbi:MAG: hypothetical protein JXB49_07975 [Bacteroidales bacterium]|nr:hypothetical protein [Bacteroidales bacterium]
MNEYEKQFLELMENCEDPQEAWDSKIVKRYLTNQTIAWILPLADWKVGATLTFRDEKPVDVALSYWKRLIRALNKDAFGNHYVNIVKHSYFSYAYGIEYQKRDVIHFHAIMDKPINFKLIHKFWNAWAGYAWTDIVKSHLGFVSYISKYNLKGGQVESYKAIKDFVPQVVPDWWKTDEEFQPIIFEIEPGLLSDREIGSHPGRC